MPSTHSRDARTKLPLAILIAGFTLSTTAVAQTTEIRLRGARDFVTGAPKAGLASPAAKRYSLRNVGSTAADWSASTDAVWLQLSPSSGSLAPGADVTVLATVDQAYTAARPLGQSQASIVFTNDTDGVGIAQVAAELHIGFTMDEDEHFRLNGRPYVPIGVWAQPPQDSWAAFHAALGIDVLVGNGYGTTATNGDFLDAAANHGMLGMLNYDSNVQNHPALLGWYLHDEPDIHNTPPAEVLATFNSWKAQDPEHLIMMNLTGFFYNDNSWGSNAQDDLYTEYTAIPDWVAFDFYPIAGFNRPELLYVPGAATEMMADQFLQHRAPVWTWIEAADINTQFLPLDTPGPTATQMRFEIWDSIVCGAKAIGYFTISFDPWSWANLTPALEAELVRSNADLKRLTPLIVAKDSDLDVSITEQNGQKFNYMVKSRGARTAFVFVTNADMAQPYRSASMNFSFPVAPTRVEVFGENRTIVPSGNGFSDSFDPLEVHIYKVRF